MMEYLPELMLVITVQLLGVMSPGPDFAMICRSSLVYSRRTGLFSALGIATGIIVHVAYCLMGIALVISQSILLFSAIKMVGAAYLIYVGYKSLKAKKKLPEALDYHKEKDLTPWQAVRAGFWTNVLNPKATMFFLAMFTQVIQPSTPLAVQSLYGVVMVIITMLWFSSLTLVLSHPVVRGRFDAVQHWVERTMGVVLIALGLKVATSTVD
jgi:RhtB (resistance to homoserine/threonine) family protein